MGGVTSRARALRKGIIWLINRAPVPIERRSPSYNRRIGDCDNELRVVDLTFALSTTIGPPVAECLGWRFHHKELSWTNSSGVASIQGRNSSAVYPLAFSLVAWSSPMGFPVCSAFRPQLRTAGTPKHRKSLILAVTFLTISSCSAKGGTRIRSCRTER